MIEMNSTEAVAFIEAFNKLRVACIVLIEAALHYTSRQKPSQALPLAAYSEGTRRHGKNSHR